MFERNVRRGRDYVLRSLRCDYTSGMSETVQGKCPNCAGPISSELFFAPVTPGLDILFVLTGGVAAIAALLFFFTILGLMYAAKDGVAFFYFFSFYFVPAGCLFLFFGGSFAVTWYVRSNARRPRPIGL